MEFSRLNERSILVNECVYVFLCLYRIVTSSSFLKSDKIVAADGERMYEKLLCFILSQTHFFIYKSSRMLSDMYINTFPIIFIYTCFSFGAIL